MEASRPCYDVKEFQLIINSGTSLYLQLTSQRVMLNKSKLQSEQFISTLRSRSNIPKNGYIYILLDIKHLKISILMNPNKICRGVSPITAFYS